MLKNKLWLGIILSIILLAFSINGFAFDYTYTQQSGEGFFVAFPDKSDAWEDTNEIRLIVNDLGALLVHSKMDGTYPKDLEAGGTLAIPNSALVSFSTGTKGDLWYCPDTNVWTKLSIGADNQILVVATDVPNWETPSSNLLSDVDDIGMLNENEDITGAWTISTGSIAGIDNTEFGYLNGITAFGGSIIDDADEAAFKATVNLEIGTDVLAYQVIGIANDNLVEMDDLDAAVDDYCKLTANGIVGRSYSEVKTDLGIDLTLYYLKTDINTLGKLETLYTKDIIDSDELAALKFTDLDDTPAAYDNGKYAKSTVDGVVWDIPTGGYTNLTQFVDQTAWRLFYSNNLGDVIELAFGTDGQYLKSTGATSAPEFDTPTGAGDMLKATYDSDEDDEIDVAGGGTEKASWTQYCIPYLSNTTVFGEIPIGTAEYALTVNAGENGYDWTKFVTPQLSEDIDLNEHSIRVDATLSSDGDYSAIKKDLVTMGENVVYGQLVYKKWSDGEWYLAKADAATTAPALGIALETKGDGETCLILREGYIRDDDWNFTAWMVYLSDTTAGGVLSTAPDTAGDQVQRVGDAKTADIMYFCPSIDVGEI